jgi:gliding motility-associated-like protein
MKFPEPLKFYFLLAAKISLFFFAFLLPHISYAQTDKLFWFVAPSVSPGDNRDFNKPIYLRITTSATAANVVISLPADPSFSPIVKNIGANSTVTLDLTEWIDQLQNSPPNTTLNKGLLITSTADITAYYEVVSGFCNCDPEIFSLKGKNALGTEFFISSQNTYDESTSYSGTNSFDIVATENNTHITITPKKDIVGHNANTPFTIILNKGQTYSAEATSTSATRHLQGSYISSDNPVAVTLKDDLVQVSSCADLIGDQAVPTNVLGTEYIVTKGFLQSDDKIYILAVENNTTVYTGENTNPVAVLAKGESTTLDLSDPSVYIHSDKKIYVYHLTGNGCEVGSAVIPKLNCTGSRSVSIVRSKDELFAVMITTKNGNQNNFKINGVSNLIKSSDFSAVPGTGEVYVTARIDLSQQVSVGSALTFSNSLGNFSLGFINGGTNSGTLYGYFSDFKSSNVQKASVETCPTTPVQLTAYGGISYSWTPAAGLSNSNIANPMASPEVTTNYTVTITNADGCVDYANVLVKVTTDVSRSISIEASSNNVCPGTLVTFTAIPVNGGNLPVYQWQVNGVNAGVNSPSFNTSALVDGDKVTCIMTSNAQCAPVGNVTSNSITMNVSTNTITSVSIAAAQNNICEGTIVNFIATPVNGGSTPIYQWKVNGVNAGVNSANFSSDTLINGDKVSCMMTSSSSACSVSANVVSNVITIVMNANLTPSVSIAASQNNVCEGTTVNFTATPVNGGSTPVFQWQINGINTGMNSTTLSSNSLVNGDKVTCHITGNARCATPSGATSNVVTMVINPYVTPSITIAASTNNICPGELITFNANPLNGGLAPAYQWQVNGLNEGNNTATFASTTFVNGDVVKCIITSNAPCTAIPTANSNSIIVVVNPPVSPSVDITVSANNICYGDRITFTAIPKNGGNAPVYQWKVNGNPTGTNSNKFISSNLNNNDVVSCFLTSNTHCAVPVTAISNNISMFINPLPIVYAGEDKTIEKGDNIKLTATASGNVSDVTWSPSAGLNDYKSFSPTASPDNTTLYTVTVRSSGGCTSTATVKITVLIKITIPNTFTPNGDGTNDVWEIKNLTDYADSYVKVFNRWGAEVYRSSGNADAWDGTRKGKPLPAGTYYYIINLNKNTPPITGYVLLIR